jgi:hypothetical protein
VISQEETNMRRPRLGCLAITLAVIAFLALVISGAMRGAIFQAALTPVAEVEPAAPTSQCEPLPAAPVPSPSASASLSPSASASASALASPAGSATAAVQLCVSVQAGQDSIKGGQTATWSITVLAQGGTVPAVTVSLTSAPAGTAPAFTSTCPSGSGTASCDLGDLATALTPASYVLGAQVTVPAGAAAGTLTLTAAADTASSPAMTAYPAAGQAITILTTPKAKPTPTAKPSPARSTLTPEPAPAPAYDPPTQPADPDTAGEPALGALPTDPVTTTTTAPAGNVASVLPVIAPATAQADPDPIASTPVANIQDLPGPSSSSPQAGTFRLTIAMSAGTAEILGLVILALVLVLAATRVTATRLARSRPRTAPDSQDVPRHRRFTRMTTLLPRFPRSGRRQRAGRDERRAAREANWRRHLESERKALPPPPPHLRAGHPALRVGGWLWQSPGPMRVVATFTRLDDLHEGRDLAPESRKRVHITPRTAGLRGSSPGACARRRLRANHQCARLNLVCADIIQCCGSTAAREPLPPRRINRPGRHGRRLARA